MFSRGPPDTAAADESVCAAQMVKLETDISTYTGSKGDAETKCETELKCMAEVRSHLADCQAVALKELKGYFTAPPATFHVLQAVFHLLGKEQSDFATWSRSWYVSCCSTDQAHAVRSTLPNLMLRLNRYACPGLRRLGG